MNNPKIVYEEMVRSITDLDLRKCARILTYHIGQDNAISLENLASMVFGSSRETDKRKAREVMETLIETHGMAICSHSGKPGRWLAATKEEAITAAAEREARAEKLLLSAKKLRAARLPAAHEPDLKSQMGLGF